MPYKLPSLTSCRRIKFLRWIYYFLHNHDMWLPFFVGFFICAADLCCKLQCRLSFLAFRVVCCSNVFGIVTINFSLVFSSTCCCHVWSSWNSRHACESWCCHKRIWISWPHSTSFGCTAWTPSHYSMIDHTGCYFTVDKPHCVCALPSESLYSYASQCFCRILLRMQMFDCWNFLKIEIVSLLLKVHSSWPATNLLDWDLDEQY
jgi:hypothetical protein